jgi:hypothetical protein
MFRQDAQDILRSRGSNVPEDRQALKRKVRLFCAEAVEDEDLLWKVQEKPGKFVAADLPRRRRIRFSPLRQCGLRKN